jgi:hypothetical protein
MTSEAVQSAIGYLVVVGLVQGAVFAVFSIAGLIAAPFLGWKRYRSIVVRVGLFNVALLAAGTIGNLIWVALTFGKYVEMDPVIDFFPFIPFGQWVLDATWGGQSGYLTPGVLIWQLRVLWTGVAALVWLVAIRISQRIVGRRLIGASLATWFALCAPIWISMI